MTVTTEQTLDADLDAFNDGRPNAHAQLYTLSRTLQNLLADKVFYHETDSKRRKAMISSFTNLRKCVLISRPRTQKGVCYKTSLFHLVPVAGVRPDLASVCALSLTTYICFTLP
jgi:hypothetical protein